MSLRNFSWSPICAPICSLNKGYLDLLSKSIPKKYSKYIQNTRDGRKLGLYWKWLWMKRVNKSNRNMASMVGNWHAGGCGVVSLLWSWLAKFWRQFLSSTMGSFPFWNFHRARPTTTVLVCSCGYCHCADSLHLFLLFFFQFVVGEGVNADASNDNRQSMRTTQMNLTMRTMANGIGWKDSFGYCMLNSDVLRWFQMLCYLLAALHWWIYRVKG